MNNKKPPPPAPQSFASIGAGVEPALVPFIDLTVVMVLARLRLSCQLSFKISPNCLASQWPFERTALQFIRVLAHRE